MANQSDEHVAADLASQAQQVLVETGRVLTESIEYESTLQNVARLLVPALADWCVVDLVQDGQLLPVAVMHTDPDKVNLVRELRQNYPLQVNDRIGAPNVIRTGRTELYETLTDDHLQQAAADEQHLEVLRSLKLRSVVVVPLVARGDRLGAITLASEQARQYSDSDLPLIEELGRRCGLAVDNARSYQTLQRELAEHRKTQESLRENEERFRLLIEQVQDYAIYMLDPQGRVSSWNLGAERIKGYKAQQILGQHYSVFYEPQDAEAGLPQRNLDEARQQGHHVDEGWRVRQDGSRFWAHVSITALRDAAGHLRGFSKITRDLTARHEAEMALQASEERLRLVMENVSDYAIIMTDPDGRITSWNSGARAIFGYTRPEVLGQPADVIFTPEDRAAGVPAQELREALNEGRAGDVRWQLRKDGSRFWANGVLTALRNGAGSLQGFVKILRDQTEAKRTEQALRDSERRYRTLFESIDEGFCIIEILLDDQQRPVDYRFVEINPAFAGQTGLNDAIGKTAYEVIPDLEKHWVEIFGQVALTREPTRFTQGSEALGRWFDVYAFPTGEPRERKVALLFSNVTAQKQAEQERERLLNEINTERQRLGEIFHYAPSFMCILRGPDHVFERANDLYVQLVGNRELIGKPLREVLPEVEGQGFIKLLDRVYRTGEPYVGTDVPIFLRLASAEAEPETRWLNFVYQPLRDAGGSVTGIFVQGVDLTERKKTEDALRESERQQQARAAELEALMDSVPAVVFVAHDAQGRHITGNRTAHEFLRRPAGANLSRSAEQPERPENFRVYQEGVELPGEQLPVQRAARGEAVYGEELEVRFEDGSARYLFGNAIPLRDEAGELRGALSAMIDITSHKQAEQQLQQLNQTLEQRVAERTADAEQRAAQLQAMAVELGRTEERERRRLAEILHDHLQQLLAASKMQVSIIGRQVQDPELEAHLEKVAELLSESLETSRNLTVELSPPILYESGLVSTLEWLSRWMREKHDLIVHLDVNEAVELDDQDMRILVFQSVRELLFNAAKYADVQEARVHLRLADQGRLEIQVSDQGRGFDPHEARTRRGEKGGFGLFSIRERLGLIGGQLHVWSKPEQGTSITLHVPLHQRRASEDASQEGNDGKT